MSSGLEISDIELHAFIDGALDAEQSRAVQERIDVDPALAKRVAAFRADKEMLKRVYAPLIDRPIPESWFALARGPVARPAVSWRMVGSIAATALLAVAAPLAYRQTQAPANGEIVQAALDARAHAAGKIIAIAADAEARQYDAVLNATVASNVKAPDLQKLGYRLAAIRLYPASHGAGAAELDYRDKDQRLFTLYVRRSNGVARFDQFERNGLRVCVWEDEAISTVMTGNVSTAAMQRLASVAYSDLTL